MSDLSYDAATNRIQRPERSDMSEPTPLTLPLTAIEKAELQEAASHGFTPHGKLAMRRALFQLDAAEAEVSRLKADNERLRAELIDERNEAANICAGLLKAIAETGEHQGTFGGPMIEEAAQAILRLRATVAAREATIALTQEALKLAEMRLTDEARQRTSQAAADLHYAASQCRAALASDAGSSLLARLRSAEAVCEFVDENAPDGHTSECRSVDPIHYAMGCDCWRGQMRELVAAWRKTL